MIILAVIMQAILDGACIVKSFFQLEDRSVSSLNILGRSGGVE
jgi:hypothetical protein